MIFTSHEESATLRLGLVFVLACAAGCGEPTTIHPDADRLEPDAAAELDAAVDMDAARAVDAAPSDDAAENVDAGADAASARDGGEATDWASAIASSDLSTIRAWYEQNTGFESCHDDELGRALTAADLEPMEGVDVFEAGTVLERKDIRGRVRIFADDVVIRCSRITVASLYGVQATYVPGVGPGGAGAEPGERWLLERLTIRGPSGDGEPASRAIFASSRGTARHVEVLEGFSSGLRSESSHDQLWEYNYVASIEVRPDSHNTSFTLRSNSGASAVRDITVRRNLLLDGTSAALSFYPRSAELHSNVLFEENVFDIVREGSSVNYCVNRGDDYLYDNVRWLGNVYGQTQTSMCGTSGPASGSGATESRGNRFVDGTTID